MKKIMVLFLAILLSLSLACNLTSGPTVKSTSTVGSSSTDKSSLTDESEPAVESSAADESEPVVESSPTETPIPTPTSIPSAPVSIRAGFASLNAYSLVIEATFSGSAQADFSQTRAEIKKSNDQDAIYTHYVITQPAEGDSAPSTTDSYAYTIGNAQCSGSDANGWTYTTTTPQQSEMQELFSELIDIVPLIDAPTFVGSETMNGIMTNHFTFQVSGLGLQSGAEVTTNQGDYWLAQDGQYIVKYSLVTETVDPTTQATLHMELLIELTDINQPVDIAFPAGCVP